MGIKRLCVLLMVFVCGFSYIASTQAQLTFGSKWGHVMARAVVRDESGQPIIVEFNDQGYEIGEVTQLGQYQNDRSSLLILQAEEYRFHRQRLEDFNSTYEQTLAADARLMTVPQFMSGTYPTADNITNIAPQRPPQNIKSVLVRGQSNRIVNDPSQLILLAFPLDMVNSNVHVSDDARSIVVSPEGLVLYASNNTIGYRTGFFGDPNERQDPFALGRLDREDEIFGPVAGARVTVSEIYPGGTTVSGQDGRYSMTYILPTCPLGGFDYTTDLYVELNYRNFMPYGSPVIPYYLRSQAWDFCYASLMPAGPFGLLPIYVSNGGGSIVNLNMYVDVMFVSGHIKLANQAGDTVPLADSTSYQAFDQEEQDTLSYIYDFNGDGQNDYVEAGAILNQRMVDGACASILDDEGQVTEAFVRESEFCSADTEANMQGVWFDIQNEDPDLVRIMDKQKRIEDIGMLATISAEDYKNTDILVFRESTGQLVMERRGLPSEEVEGSRQAVAYDENEQQVSYRVMLRGPKDRDLNIGGASRAGGFEEWAARSYMTEPFSVREANHLKPGEFIKIVAINRSTGYIGTVRVQLTTQSGGNIGIAAETITMRPPNLKIWAEREYDIEHGLTPDDERYRHYTIGAEGASLTSDTTVTVYTEWLDHDGSALPEGLGDDNGEQYGLTGRLARIVSEGVLRSVAQSDLAEFPIAPGRQTQALRVASNQELAEHFYLHVIGKPRDQECGQVCPNFEDTGASIGAAPPFDTRPRFLTPFYVPLFDEQKHWQEYNAYREQKRNFDTDNPTGVEPQKPLPAYAWKYRPEYQFSRFELEMQAINRVEEGDNGSTYRTNVLDAGIPVIGGGNNFIEALYSLIGSNLERLTPIDGEQRLVLALGEHEQLIELGQSGTIRFDNIAHLASLDVEDYLSMRLYTNNDAGNILWEWGFGQFSLFPERNNALSAEENTFYVSVDDLADGPVQLTALLVGSEEYIPLAVQWEMLGDGSIQPHPVTNSGGIFGATLILPFEPGAQATVTARLGNHAEVISPTFVVVPGKAHAIEIEQSGSTVVGGLGGVELIIRAVDIFQNPVADGTIASVIAPAFEILGEAVFEAGEARITIKGDIQAGELPVEVTVDGVGETTTVQVHDIQLEFANVSDIGIEESRTFRINASSDYGNLDGVVVEVAVQRGSLSAHSLTLEGNTASVEYSSGRYRGFAQFSALVASTTVAHTQSFSVTESGDYLTKNVLVTDGPGTIQLDNGSFQYTNVTELVVSATPGEVVETELFDIFKPPLYPLQDFNSDLNQTFDFTATRNRVLDYSSGINAEIHNAGFEESTSDQFNNSWILHASSYFEIPEHARTRDLAEAGFNFWIKAPDSISGSVELVDWDDFGLTLTVNPDRTLTLTGRFANGSQSITSSASLIENTWHHIAIHSFQGTLYLGLDDQVDELSVGMPLQAPDSESYALRLNADSGFENVELAGMRLYDWNGEKSLQTVDGGFTGSVVADSNGEARISLTAAAPTFAYKRIYHQPSEQEVEAFYASISRLFVPAAYALPFVSDQCESTFAPVSPDVTDPLIAKAERFMTVMIECLVKPKLDEARVRYRTASGWREKTVAFINRAKYEGMYKVLNDFKSQSIAVANCLDAAITGSNTSGVGIACDIITSFFLIGDIRDFLIQSFHYYIGDESDYDPLTHQLASVGLIASLATVAAGAGAAPNIIAATGKVIAKILKLIPNGSAAAAKLGIKLKEIITNSNLSRSEKVTRLAKFIPLFEIGAAFALVFNDNPKLFRFFASLIVAQKDSLDNFIEFIERYSLYLGNPVAATNTGYDQYFSWNQRARGWLLPDVYAAGLSAVLKTRFVTEMNQLLAKYADDSAQVVAQNFDQALSALIRGIRNGTYRLADVPDHMLVVKAFMEAGEMSANGISKLANLGPWRLGRQDVFSNTTLINAIAEISVRKLTADGVQNVQKGLAKLMANLDSLNINFVKGNLYHIMVIAKLAKTGAKIRAIELIDDVVATTTSGTSLPSRYIDILVEMPNGAILKVEVKNLLSDTWKENITKLMSRSIGKATDDVAGEITEGQLFTDLIKYIENGFSGRALWLSPDVLPNSNSVNGVIDAATKSAKEDEVIEYILAQFKKNESDFAQYLNMDVASESWRTLLDNLEQAMKNANNKYVKIEDLQELL